MWTPGIPLMAVLVPVNRWGKQGVKILKVDFTSLSDSYLNTRHLVYLDRFCL